MKLKWNGEATFRYEGEYRCAGIELAPGSIVEEPSIETAAALKAAGWVDADAKIEPKPDPKVKGGG